MRIRFVRKYVQSDFYRSTRKFERNDDEWMIRMVFNATV